MCALQNLLINHATPEAFFRLRGLDYFWNSRASKKHVITLPKTNMMMENQPLKFEDVLSPIKNGDFIDFPLSC